MQIQSLSSLLPFECSNYDVLDQQWRKVSLANDGSENKCDLTLTSAEWKRFADNIGGKMPEFCPEPQFTCGTDGPGWLNGTHPAVGKKTSRHVCFKFSERCCWLKLSVDVTNCVLYYVYNLPKPPTCSSAYCGNA